MELLTNLATTDGNVDDSAVMAYGGLVDRRTAAAEDVLLWSDPVITDLVAAAAAPVRTLAVA